MSASSTVPGLSAVSTDVGTGVIGWHAKGRPLRVLLAGLALCFAALMAVGLFGYQSVPHPANDFFAFDSYSRFIRHHKPSLIYDQALLRTFQGLPGHKVFAFMYPPAMLLLLWPLAFLPYALGYLLWLGVGMAACAATIGTRRGAWPLALLAVVAPSTLWTQLCGQSTLLLAAFLLGGMLLSPRRPVLAGLLIGLATYKPQLGLLVPVALVASGQWRTIAAAAVTVLLIVASTMVAFGSDIWLAWATHLDSIVEVRTKHASGWAPLLSTVSSDLATLGAGRRAADLGQAASLVAVVICIWRCFRGRGAGPIDTTNRLKVAALGAATFLATPFAFIYDLPLFTASVLLFVDERRRAGEAFHSVEILLIVAGLLAPFAFLIDGLHSSGSLIVLLVLAAILRRLWALGSQQPVACQAPASG